MKFSVRQWVGLILLFGVGNAVFLLVSTPNVDFNSPRMAGRIASFVVMGVISIVLLLPKAKEEGDKVEDSTVD